MSRRSLRVVAATLYGLFGVPADLNQGDAQRIMYPHVLRRGSRTSPWRDRPGRPWLAGCGTCASTRWLCLGGDRGPVHRAPIWGGRCGAGRCGAFLAWDDPRLTTTALLLALYVGYLLLRRLSDDPARRATRAAVVGLVAAIDIPIVHFSVIGGGASISRRPSCRRTDPESVGARQFVLALVGMLAAFTLAWTWLMIRRYQLARAELGTRGAA